MDFFYMNEKDRAEDAKPLDEETGDKYSRVVEEKGLGRIGEILWLVKDISGDLKAWGHFGGEGHRFDPEVRCWMSLQSFERSRKEVPRRNRDDGGFRSVRESVQRQV